MHIITKWLEHSDTFPIDPKIQNRGLDSRGRLNYFYYLKKIVFFFEIFIQINNHLK
jgi:hypothetical protein